MVSPEGFYFRFGPVSNAFPVFSQAKLGVVGRCGLGGACDNTKAFGRTNLSAVVHIQLEIVVIGKGRHV